MQSRWLIPLLFAFGALTAFSASMTTVSSLASFVCSGSNITYLPDDLCDDDPVCPGWDDEFLCDDGEWCTKTNNLGLADERTRCPNGTYDACVFVIDLCTGSALCEDHSDERLCGAVPVCDPRCSCNTIGATCDMQGVGAERGLMLPTTTRFVKFTHFPDLASGIPIGSEEYPLLTSLFMSRNNYSDLGLGRFINMTTVRTLDLSRNSIRYIETATFEGLDSIIRLDLSYNLIINISSSVFVHVTTVRNLDVGHNQIALLRQGTFEHLPDITDLLLRSNNISIIEPGAFNGLNNVFGISFTDNKITALREGAMNGLSSVEWLSLRQNPLSYIEPGAFENTTQVKWLLMSEAALTNLHPDMFRGLDNLESLSTDDYRLCCLFKKTEVCEISAQTELDSCTRLMPNTVLRVCMWVLGVSALLGNTMVLVIRLFGRRERGGAEQPFFITNLAVADLFMGVFMLIIASADIYFGEYFFLYAPHWRESMLCRFAGFLAILSSESSVFLLTVITVDRLTNILFPLSRFHFRYKSSRAYVAVMWCTTVILGVMPLIVGKFVPNFYGLSDVCIGLPLSLANTQTGSIVYDKVQGNTVFKIADEGYVQPSWIYSIILFLVINLLCFCFILVCYVIIFFSVRKSAKSVGGARHARSSSADQEIKMAAKMALIVGTDFCCWMPVIIMGVLSQTGLVRLPVTLYAWCAVFILPINASLNPYLYTVVAHVGQRKPDKKRQPTPMNKEKTKPQGAVSSDGNTVKNDGSKVTQNTSDGDSKL